MKFVIAVTFLMAAVYAPLITAQRGSYAGTGSITNGNREDFNSNSANRVSPTQQNFEPIQDNSVRQQPQYYPQQQPQYYQQQPYFPQGGFFPQQPQQAFVPGTFFGGR